MLRAPITRERAAVRFPYEHRQAEICGFSPTTRGGMVIFREDGTVANLKICLCADDNDQHHNGHRKYLNSANLKARVICAKVNTRSGLTALHYAVKTHTALPVHLLIQNVTRYHDYDAGTFDVVDIISAEEVTNCLRASEEDSYRGKCDTPLLILRKRQ